MDRDSVSQPVYTEDQIQKSELESQFIEMWFSVGENLFRQSSPSNLTELLEAAANGNYVNLGLRIPSHVEEKADYEFTAQVSLESEVSPLSDEEALLDFIENLMLSALSEGLIDPEELAEFLSAAAVASSINFDVSLLAFADDEDVIGTPLDFGDEFEQLHVASERSVDEE